MKKDTDSVVDNPAPPENNGAAEPARMVIRVRRGALRRFDQLKQKSAGLPVDIEWDRRVANRRNDPAGVPGNERRRGERRQEPPFTWTTADFVVVGDTSSRKKRR